jgi:hypothetical protein
MVYKERKASWSSTGLHVTDAEVIHLEEIAGDVSYAQTTTYVNRVGTTKSIAIIVSNVSIPNARRTKTLVVMAAGARTKTACSWGRGINVSSIPMKIGVRDVKQMARHALGRLK